MPLRAKVATSVSKTAAALSRAAGRGDGSVIGGWIGLKIDPDLLAHLASGRAVALVSGTNGKTTTTRLVAAALSHIGRVATNSFGANMPTGHTSALAKAGQTPFAVLEVDEHYLPRVIDETKPRVVALLNLSRDQLDRAKEVAMMAQLWRDALAGHPEVRVVAGEGGQLGFANRGRAVPGRRARRRLGDRRLDRPQNRSGAADPPGRRAVDRAGLRHQRQDHDDPADRRRDGGAHLSRDQLDRAKEVAMMAQLWKTALAAHQDVKVVANADDPMVVWAASGSPYAPGAPRTSPGSAPASAGSTTPSSAPRAATRSSGPTATGGAPAARCAGPPRSGRSRTRACSTRAATGTWSNSSCPARSTSATRPPRWPWRPSSACARSRRCPGSPR